ncbi:3'-5' exonuclease [Amycolatopsis sp. GM8]|uniref:3'-5' exonuclease n=1 Tax=Amycolatopsis sp. GM8 TaxID=2896530 RepID=UPI002103E7E7|nr:3'-5' exonuclease [Amycolatopsis sp. GM8]
MAPLDTLRLARDGRFPATETEFTAIDFRTTGLRPGHVVEAAAVRVRADGTVLTEYTTMVNPGWHVETGPETLHHISRRELDSAPTFAEVLGDLLELCQNAVLVAHNLPVTLEFLAAELAPIDVRLPPLPAIGTLETAREALRLPNSRLATVAAALGIPDFPGHLALANARTVAAVVSGLISRHGLALTDAPRFPELPPFAGGEHGLSRQFEEVLGRTWLADLAGRARSAAEDPVREAYGELLAAAVTDHYVSPDESRDLAKLAAGAGIAVREENFGFVAAMRDAAEERGALTEAEARDLTGLATALGVPEAAPALRPRADLRDTDVLFARVPVVATGRHVWAARALMAAGLLVMVLSLVILLAGGSFVGALLLAISGVAALCGGWYLSEPPVS